MKLALKKATLIKRYKRFLADVILEDGTTTTIHCANTGAMTGCAEPRDTIWYSESDNPKRKYPFSWELTHTQANDFICVNTLKANKLAQEAIEAGLIPQLNNYTKLQAEVKYGLENSRIDFKLSFLDKPDYYVEVKSVTLLTEPTTGLGQFPDAVTTRGQKHLKELMTVKQQGKNAMLLFIVMHTGIKKICAAKSIDPVYSHLLSEAKMEGVDILAFGAEVTSQSINIKQSLLVT